jgi:CheY-like chemotaxis protein
VGTVLVADDDPVVRSLAASVLREAGYMVELADDGVHVPWNLAGFSRTFRL